MPRNIKLDSIFRKSLIRHYYFAEATAVYECYDQPLVETCSHSKNSKTRVATRIDHPCGFLLFFTVGT
jgi:hypothetical protein